MSMISLRLPDSLHKAARQLADKEEISLNQLVQTAVAEKVSALAAEEIVLQRAKSGSRERFLAALDRSPDIPDPYEVDDGDPTVGNTLARQNSTVQQFCRKLMEEIVVDGVEAYSTWTQGGDLRFRVENGIFAEIKFFRRSDEVTLRLYFSPDVVLDKKYKLFEPKTSEQAKYDRRLIAANAIPDDVVKNIRRARHFMLNKQGRKTRR